MKRIEPSVSLISHNADLSQLYTAARRCYSSAGEWSDFQKSIEAVDRKKMEKLIKDCVRRGHDSILEHVTFTFHITCSRACSHQLVRHRIASYSQQSQRYVKMESIPYRQSDFNYLPDDKRHKCEMVVDHVLRDIEEGYRKLIELGARPEDARDITPQMTITHIVTTVNCRSLLNFFAHRCCLRAQKEIQMLAGHMLAICALVLPEVFENAGPKCLKLKRCDELKPCGLKPWKKEA